MGPAFKIGAAGAAAALALTLTAACSGSHPTTAGSSADATGHPHSVTGLARQLGDCIHAHGAPDFPEPSINPAGQLVFPDNAPDLPPAAETACRSIIDQLPAPVASSGSALPPHTLQQWLAFARCMRSHGLPQWPDPQPDGSFALPTSLRTSSSDTIAPAFEACRALSPNPNGKFEVSGTGR
jgi:hypothetical protein